MFKAKDLEEIEQPICVTNENASEITIDKIRQLFARIADEESVPYLIGSEEVKYGGLLDSEVVSAIVISHPEHQRDYYGVLVAIQNDYGAINIHAYCVGKSRQMKKFAISEMGKQQRKGQSLSFKIGNLAMQGLMTIGKSKDKLAAEQAWYDAVISIIDASLEQINC